MSEKKKAEKATEPKAEEPPEPAEVAEPKDAAPPKKKAKKGAAAEDNDGAEEDAAAPSKGTVGRSRIHGTAQEAKTGLKAGRKKKATEPAEAKEPPAKKAKKAPKAKKPKAAPKKKKKEKKVVDNKPRPDDQMMNLRRVCRWLIGGSNNVNLKKMCDALGLPATGNATVLKNKLEDALAVKNFPKNKTFKPSVAETEMDDDTFNALMEKDGTAPLTIRKVCETLANL